MRSHFAGMSAAEAIADTQAWYVRRALRKVDAELCESDQITGRSAYAWLCLRVAVGCVVMAFRAPGRLQ